MAASTRTAHRLLAAFVIVGSSFGATSNAAAGTRRASRRAPIDFTVRRLNLSRLLPGSLDSLRYVGSLTTPPLGNPCRGSCCSPIRASTQQIEALKALFEDGNSREMQPLHGRKVLVDADLDGPLRWH